MLRNLATSVLLTAAFALSLFYKSYQDPLQFPVMVLIGAAFITSFTLRQFTLPSSLPVIGLIALTTLFITTFALSTVPFSSQIAFCIFCALPITFLTLSNTEENNQTTGIFLFPIIALSLWAALQTLTLTRATGPLLDPNTLAIILGASLICSAGVTLSSKKPFHLILTLIIFAGLIATASRSGLICTIIGLTVLIFAAQIRIQRKTALIIAGSSLIICALLGSTLWHQFTSISTTDPSITDRLALWNAAWQIALAYPLTGTGPGTFHLYYPSLRTPADQSLGIFTHSDLLQMAAEMGFAAPLIIYAFFTAILLRTIHAIKNTDANLRLAILTPFAALLSIALQAHVNYPLYILPVMIGCGILLALWHRATVTALNDGITTITLTLPKRLAVSAAGLLVLTAILSLSFTASAGLYYLKKSREASDPGTSLLALGWSEKLAPLSFIDPEVEMARINLDLLNQPGRITSPKLKDDLLRETTRILDTAAYWNPAWAEIDFLHGEMERIQSSKAVMVTNWREAIRKNPQYFDARRSLAMALTEEHRPDEALKIVEDGLNYKHTIAYREWASNFLLKTRKQP